MVAVVVALATIMFLAGSPAAAADGYGHVEFANSGAPSAQADFLDGVALLHDFEYEPAAAAFRRSKTCGTSREWLEPSRNELAFTAVRCRSGYWGESSTCRRTPVNSCSIRSPAAAAR